MTASLETRPTADEMIYRFRRERPSRGWGRVFLGLLFVAALALGGTRYFGGTTGATSGQADGSTTADVNLALRHTAARARLLITVVAAGNLESSKNIDVKCQVAGGVECLGRGLCWPVGGDEAIQFVQVFAINSSAHRGSRGLLETAAKRFTHSRIGGNPAKHDLAARSQQLAVEYLNPFVGDISN